MAAPAPQHFLASSCLPAMRTIKGLLLVAALAFSASMVALIFFPVAAIYERSVRDDAIHDAETLAHVTFSTMFQLMSTGWSREQLDNFGTAVAKATEGSETRITIYRGAPVERLFGVILQKHPDTVVRQALGSGLPARLAEGDEVRIVFPLKAEAICLRCHVNVQAGEVLGAIDVHQHVTTVIDDNRKRFALALLPIIPVALIATYLMAAYINRRIRRAIDGLAGSIDAVNRVDDLRLLSHSAPNLGFSDFAPLGEGLQNLTGRLRSIAVDRDMLEFEIRLLEKFIITSDVVRDWREYVNRILIDINSVTDAYALFSIFKVDDEIFDLEIFWRGEPGPSLKKRFEKETRNALAANSYFGDGYAIHIIHNVADATQTLPDISNEEMQVRTKSLLVAAPKIGGIVGIGMHSGALEDASRLLVVDSILSTLLNVVGSVKAIHKFTRELEYYATRDPLTNLLNQRVFWELLDAEVSRSKRHDNSFGLLVIDCDNFKSINDTYGHAFGDVYLQEITAALKGALRDDDLLARYGGDEFTAILPETAFDDASMVARRILQRVEAISIRAPDGTGVTASVSIGMAQFPDHSTDARDLFLFADNMMYRAKADGRNRVAIPTADDIVDVFKSIGEKSIVILNAVEHNRAEPYFQPILNVGAGGFEAVEVLSRLRLDDGTLLVADDFVPIAERMGVMHKMDFLLMEKALKAVAASGFKGYVFLNMSPRALVLNDFVPEARRIVGDCGFPPERIVFEITERETIKNMALLEKFINHLKAEGFRLAIDDFGSGFSSFHYVKRFPIDFLKIEGEFVVNMVRNDKDRALVKSIVALARELKIRTVAEYVETPEVLAAVSELGIDLAQGHHIGRPRPELPRPGGGAPT
jgi:diguanylate cyclase (GGDEF)-like protein